MEDFCMAVTIEVEEALARAVAVSAFPIQQRIQELGHYMISSAVTQPPVSTKNHALYDKDIYAWSQATAALIRAGRWFDLDPEALAEEIESVGASDYHAVSSAIYQILVHLLKWHYQPARQSHSWRISLIEHRNRIPRRLDRAPSLESHIGQMIEAEYPRACRKASAQTRLLLSTFPEHCPWSEAQIRDIEFYPE
jgi:hypothetical protein